MDDGLVRKTDIMISRIRTCEKRRETKVMYAYQCTFTTKLPPPITIWTIPYLKPNITTPYIPMAVVAHNTVIFPMIMSQVPGFSPKPNAPWN